ncbi:SEMA3C isoform 7 [Pan troglodytes]|uniref:SEMA3C isoform 6 n=1 Tax=Pan troglodytes TaxID=9598 RepID=A0A2J8LGA5_PANTR|nr:SEMA3C isoform 6 [Pan troglodytes]PNI46306.1 SEMA3C isoform 7 [Pan troglodytes]
MAFRTICVLIGVFICSICVKGSSQPQARVYLTFDEPTLYNAVCYICGYKKKCDVNLVLSSHLL